jgi:post-segregation antitoxin (ccd killing protein)
MSRKHFTALAEEIRAEYNHTFITGNVEARAAIATLAGRIARVCADSNPNFSDARFIKACGIGSTEVIGA